MPLPVVEPARQLARGNPSHLWKLAAERRLKQKPLKGISPGRTVSGHKHYQRRHEDTYSRVGRARPRRQRADVIHLKNPGHGLMCRLIFARNKFMSQHRSLKGASTIAAKRNVLKRFERVELLKKRGQWKEGGKVLGLPKTKPDA